MRLWRGDEKLLPLRHSDTPFALVEHLLVRLPCMTQVIGPCESPRRLQAWENLPLGGKGAYDGRTVRCNDEMPG